MKTKLQNFLVYDKIDQNIKKQEPLLLEDRRFYVYALLDPRFNGARMYRDLKYVFNHIPIYVGKGYGLRYESHFKEADDLWEKPEEIKKCYNPIKINKIHQIYKDYNIPKVIIIKENLTEQEAFELEKYCIKQIGRKDKKEGPLTNLTDGGDGNNGYKWNEEQRKIFSIRFRGENANWFGKHHSEETNEKNRIAHIGKKQSQDTIEKRNKTIKEKYNNGYVNPWKGKHHSEETKQNISKGNKGKIISEKTKQRMSKAQKNRDKNSWKIGKENANYGKHLSEEFKNHLSEINKNKIHIYNSELNIEKLINKDSYIPEGYIRGRKPFKKTNFNNKNKNKIWIYNSELDIERKINKNEIILEGWIKGRKPKSEETKQNISKGNKGKIISEEHKNKLSKIMKGKFKIYNSELDIEKWWSNDKPIPKGFIKSGRKKKLRG